MAARLAGAGSAIEDVARTNLPAFIRQFNPPFPSVFDNQRGHRLAGTSLHVIPHMPILAFIDRQGIIPGNTQGDDNFLSRKPAGEEPSDRRSRSC